MVGRHISDISLGKEINCDSKFQWHSYSKMFICGWKIIKIWVAGVNNTLKHLFRSKGGKSIFEVEKKSSKHVKDGAMKTGCLSCSHNAAFYRTLLTLSCVKGKEISIVSHA